MGKTFYWLKLGKEFYEDKRIKKLRRIRSDGVCIGDSCVTVYQRMLLEALPNDGFIFYDEVEENFADELALELNEDEKVVRAVVEFLFEHEMIEERDGAFFFPQTAEMSGREDESAARVRKYRKKLEENRYNVTDSRYISQNCNANVTPEFKSLRDIDIKLLNSLNGLNAADAAENCERKDSFAERKNSFAERKDDFSEKSENSKKTDFQDEKTAEKNGGVPSDAGIPPYASDGESEIYTGECGNVILLDREWRKLMQKFPGDYRERVDRLSRYIAKTGKEYQSHYATIVRWAKEDSRRGQKEKPADERIGSFDTNSFFEAALRRSYDGMNLEEQK